ncbi:S1C family serine protease [Calderihabitans maritimus]|uniref:Peptidase S1 and S6, chymotrypsin/Hap n=1 Tax=Calderihabitans maritimus TaxID=1246530 RepID=A0A1Z5HWP8_9FIRM|nr:trypsin-like peptidase domain-containing protein [Calderihabitans maritimus]GAW93761.1 peptidase S1 and S6, chymotrypsin/Hap [Calderihabitans maritimus]
MSYFERDAYYYRERKPGYFFIIVVALLSGIIGGIVALSLSPYLFPEVVPPILEEPQEKKEKQEAQLPPVPYNPAESPVVAIARQVGPAVVGITNLRGHDFFNNQLVSTGSGVIFDRENGYIVTNYHVVAGAQKILVNLDEKRQYTARLVGGDERTDLAVLKIKADNLPEAKFGDSTKLQVGEMAIAIGNPLGREFARSVTVGVISALNREVTVESPTGEAITLKLIQTDAAINPGNSGGALVNARGEVIGINSVKIARADVEGMGFAIPISDAQPIIQQLIEKGYVSRPFIGIYDFREITEEMSEWYGLPVGIYVGGIVPGGPAEKAGMKPGDIIVKIDDEIIASFEDLQKVLYRHQVGDRVTITVIRNGKRLTLPVILGEMPRR